MVTVIFYMIVFVMFVFYSRYMYVSLRTGVFESYYGENLTIRKSEGKIQFFFGFLMNFSLWSFLAYILISRFGPLQCSAEEIKNESIAANTNLASQSLPQNWINFSSDDWRVNHGLSSQCRNLDQEDEQRLKNTIPISQDSFLLLLTCELGAYQDAQFVYLVNSERQTVKELVFEVPEYTDAWRFASNKLVWGAVYRDPVSEVLEVINLSAATGMCGYVAYYKISDLLNSNPINLYNATGDDDCYNGVTVEYWPIIKSEN